MAQIINITSEALQATIRRLLPSQQGFGEDLQATNVVTPIIDLTPSAQGADTPIDLRRALGFGSITAYDISNQSGTLINTPGFYQVIYAATFKSGAAAAQQVKFVMNDALSSKQLFQIQMDTDDFGLYQGSFDVFLRTGDSLTAESNSSNCFLTGVTQQYADVNGNLVTPTGFDPQ